MSGLLINGQIVPTPGINVINSQDAAWAHLNPGDGGNRTRKPTMFMFHKTIADDPEVIIPGAGPAGADERTAEGWQQDPLYSGAHGIIGHDGRLACLADFWLRMAYHATVSNPWSVGIEIAEQVGGKSFKAALLTAVNLAKTGCPLLGIQFQGNSKPYTGHPLDRMAEHKSDGGQNVIGIFGHRDNTERRGRWDPGDVLWAMLRGAGMECFDIANGEDLKVWEERQRQLNLKGYHLVVDGVPGPATTAALAKEGFIGGIYALGKSAN